MPCLSGLYEIEINVQIWGFLFGVAGLYWNLVLARTVRNEMAGGREYPGNRRRIFATSIHSKEDDCFLLHRTEALQWRSSACAPIIIK